MDWSRLERLDIDLPPKVFLDTFHNQLTGLQSLTFRPERGYGGDEDNMCNLEPDAQDMREAYVSFIAGLLSLHELRISGTEELLDLKPILDRHGHTLQTLRIHENERDCAYETGNITWKRPTLALDELRDLRAMAPNLESLTLDLQRTHGKWPTSMFKVLSTFDNLQDLTLYLSSMIIHG